MWEKVGQKSVFFSIHVAPLMNVNAVIHIWPFAKESWWVMFCLITFTNIFVPTLIRFFMKGCYLPNLAPADTSVNGSNRTVTLYDLMAEGEMIR